MTQSPVSGAALLHARDLVRIPLRQIGVQRQAVRKLLLRDPRVEDFGDAPPEAGGWGATWVRLR